MTSTDLVINNIPKRYYTAWRISQNKSFQELTTTGLDTKTFLIEIKLAEALSKKFTKIFNRELTEEEGVYLLHNTMKNPKALNSIVRGFSEFLDDTRFCFLIICKIYLNWKNNIIQYLLKIELYLKN